MQASILPASVPHQKMMLSRALFHILLAIVALASGMLLVLLNLALIGALFSIG